MWARFLALKKSDRVRVVGRAILIAGVVGAAAFYWWAQRSVEPQLDDLSALGYTRSMQHDMGVLMGPSGLILSDVQQTLASPAGKAGMIVVVSVILTISFFRAAWVIDENERIDAAASETKSR